MSKLVPVGVQLGIWIQPRVGTQRTFSGVTLVVVHNTSRMRPRSIHVGFFSSLAPLQNCILEE